MAVSCGERDEEAVNDLTLYQWSSVSGCGSGAGAGPWFPLLKYNFKVTGRELKGTGRALISGHQVTPQLLETAVALTIICHSVGLSLILLTLG